MAASRNFSACALAHNRGKKPSVGEKLTDLAKGGTGTALTGEVFSPLIAAGGKKKQGSYTNIQGRIHIECFRPRPHNAMK